MRPGHQRLAARLPIWPGSSDSAHKVVSMYARQWSLYLAMSVGALHRPQLSGICGMRHRRRQLAARSPGRVVGIFLPAAGWISECEHGVRRDWVRNFLTGDGAVVRTQTGNVLSRKAQTPPERDLSSGERRSEPGRRSHPFAEHIGDAFPIRESEFSGRPMEGLLAAWGLIVYMAISIFLQRFGMLADLGLCMGQNKPRLSGVCGEANKEATLTPFESRRTKSSPALGRHVLIRTGCAGAVPLHLAIHIKTRRQIQRHRTGQRSRGCG